MIHIATLRHNNYLLVWRRNMEGNSQRLGKIRPNSFKSMEQRFPNFFCWRHPLKTY